MKKLIFALLLFAGLALAQEATLGTPVVRPSEAKLTVKRLDLTAAQAVISISVQDASSNEIRYYNLVVPDPSPSTQTATIAGLVTAIDTARASETGGGSGSGAITTGTLTYAITCSTTPSNAADIQINAVSSLTQTTLNVQYNVNHVGPGQPARQ